MAQRQLVTAGGAEFYVEMSDVGGPKPVDTGFSALSFEGVRNTIEGIAKELAVAWQHVKPDEAEVQFGLKITAKAGKLTGLIVEGGGEATLTVKLTWKQPGG
jgi:hypothetical protein